ncbi:MAG: methyltransferase domain-containing protein [Solirubrobacterales bacterium]
MSDAGSSTLSGANERALALLSTEARERANEHDGFIDVLGQELPTDGVAQGLMRSGVVSSIYERWWRPALGRLAKGVTGPGMKDEHRIARLLMGLVPGDGVLDLACGPGNFSREFAQAVGVEGLVVGLDASPAMLERGVRDTDTAGARNLAFVYGNAIELPFRDDSFDAVCCFAALHLFDDPFAALDEQTRVLTAGGHIAIFTSCRSRSGPFRGYKSMLAARSGMRMFEQDEITGALLERGFADMQQTLTGLTQFVGGQLSA